MGKVHKYDERLGRFILKGNVTLPHPNPTRPEHYQANRQAILDAFHKTLSPKEQEDFAFNPPKK